MYPGSNQLTVVKDSRHSLFLIWVTPISVPHARNRTLLSGCSYRSDQCSGLSSDPLPAICSVLTSTRGDLGGFHSPRLKNQARQKSSSTATPFASSLFAIH